MNRRAQSCLLVLFGAMLLRVGAGDLLVRYLRPGTRPWVLGAGAAVVIVGVVGLMGDREPLGRTGGTRLGWLMFAPVALGMLVTPTPLGLYSALHSAPAHPDTSVRQRFAQLAGDGVHSVKLSDVVLRVLWDSGRTLSGKQLAITGFVMAQRTDGFVLARLVVTCCAADARAMQVRIRSDQHPVEGSWVTATAVYVGTDPQSSTVPVLRAVALIPAATPADPYE